MIEQAGKKIIHDMGFGQYEVSAYSHPHKACQHNMNYWEFGDYLGIGAGAHSKVTILDEQKIKRFQKYKHPKKYLSGEIIQEEKIIPDNEIPFEFMLNALRTYQNISFNLFEARTGLPREVLKAYFNEAGELMEVNEAYFKPSEKGRRFLNDLTGIFLPSA